jgi:hypothetical protein
MELKTFRVTNFRSINDSGEIDVSRITALLGRNESGKSNVLRALHSLNPADGFAALNPIKDFPRHRKLSECRDWTPVVESTWVLTPYEQKRLAEIWPHAEGVNEVTVGRRYDEARTVGIPAPSVPFDLAAIKADARKIDAAVKAKAANLPEDAKSALERASDTFFAAVGPGKPPENGLLQRRLPLRRFDRRLQRQMSSLPTRKTKKLFIWRKLRKPYRKTTKPIRARASGL